MEKNFFNNPKNSKYKNIKIYDNDITKNNFNKNFYEKRKCIILIVLLALNMNIYILKAKKFVNSLTLSNFDLNFKYELFESEIITDKIKDKSGWLLKTEEAYFINGILRRHRPKNCLELGVAEGGSSILILNAISDINNSVLISIDLNKKLSLNRKKETGFRVTKYFPELTKKWKLYTGAFPHEFLSRINIKYDFLFLDTAHVTPGEIINFIEVLPFLNENAIIIIHDILWQFHNRLPIKFYPSNLILFTSIFGEKIILTNNGHFKNVGAIFLYSNQKKYYLNYFLLLYTIWEYIPNNNDLKKLRIFIKNYYKNEVYIKNFDSAVKLNKNFFNNHRNGSKFRYTAKYNKIIKQKLAI